MDNITEYMMQQLLSVGFSYPDYEHHLNFGMLYAWKGGTFRIGGAEDGEFTDLDKQIAAEGLWLPDSSHLLDWLKGCGFTVSIHLNEDGYYHITAMDPTDGSQYTGGGLLLSHGLHKVIFKICKSGIKHSPKSPLRLEIMPEEI